MADDSTVTECLLQLPEEQGSDPDSAEDIVELDDTNMMATKELRLLLDPASELVTSLCEDMDALDDKEDADSDGS